MKWLIFRRILCAIAVMTFSPNIWSVDLSAQEQVTEKPNQASASEATKKADKTETAEKKEGAESAIDSNLSKEEQDFLKKYQAEAEQARKSLEKLRESSPYQETEAISLPADSGVILGFCVRADGGLVVISGKGSDYGAANIFQDIAKKLIGQKAIPNRVQWLDATGKIERAVDIDFKPLAINVSPDNLIYVTGQGKLQVFNNDGKIMLEAEAPHIQETVSNREKFEEEVMERHEADLESTKEQLEQMKKAIQEIEAKAEEDRSKTEKRTLAQSKSILKSYQSMYDHRVKQTKEKLVEQAIANIKEIHRVAVSKSDVYIVTREATGYGYCIWRLNPDLSSPKKIVSQLAGCCGQMDIQSIPEGIAIAENSRHRVLIVDREGKIVRTFGKGNRSDPSQGFSSCCNPMNTCCTADGLLLTAECNGLVKGFKSDGELASIYGVAQVNPGCKNSSIGIAPKGDRLYYFDIQKGTVLVLTKKS